ncbi:MAG: tight adherence protein [Thermoleophilaceae bacterium]|jgi:tight adherence protein B|nr:tight adherence protein [Thermoleophilaceae bacterium]
MGRLVTTAAAAAAVILVAAALLGLAARPRPRLLADRRLLRAPSRLAAAMADAAVPLEPDVAWSVWVVVAAVAAGSALVAAGPALALVVLAGSTAASLLGLAAGRGRSGRQVDAALPDLLDGVARSLRSGATMPGALSEQSGAPGRLGEDVRALVRAAEGGVPLVVALDAWPERCPTPGVRLAVAALALAVESGGAVAQAVDGVAATLRANLAVTGEVAAQAAQARLSGLVIALAPLAFGALAAGTDARTAHFLLRTAAGSLCIAGGLALDAVAAWWMHRITAVAP